MRSELDWRGPWAWGYNNKSKKFTLQVGEYMAVSIFTWPPACIWAHWAHLAQWVQMGSIGFIWPIWAYSGPLGPLGAFEFDFNYDAYGRLVWIRVQLI